MAGVAMVGLSGSLIKNTIKESPLGNVLGFRDAAPEPIADEPEATTALVGELPYFTSVTISGLTCFLLGVFFVLFAQIL
jgi:hypothetical protein